MFDKLMKVVEDGSTYWLEGHDRQQAVESFGEDITVELMIAIPFDPDLSVFENVDEALTKAVQK